MDLTWIMTIERDLSVLNSRPGQVRAVVQQESKVWTPESVEHIRLRSSMKAHCDITEFDNLSLKSQRLF